jgi:aminoglycoside 2'-N-acetyltransferase I
MQLSIYPSPELPTHIKCQLLSYIRVEWWWIFQNKRPDWDYTAKSTHPVNVLLCDEALLISHAEVNWRMIEHESRSYKVYGLSAVFTYPSHRKQGYGKAVVEAATKYTDESDADLAMLFCLPHLQSFYESCGWTAMPNTNVLYGAPENPDEDDEEILLMRFVSEAGKAAKERFEANSVYVGRYMW